MAIVSLKYFLFLYLIYFLSFAPVEQLNDELAPKSPLRQKLKH